MEDRADIEVDGLQRTEGALDLSQALIRAHGGAGIEGLGRHGGAQDIEAVERRLGGDGGVIADKRKIVVADGDAEVLGDLAAAEHGTDRLADGGSARERLASAANAGLDALELPLGGGEQFASLARAFLGQRRVAADDEALARIVRAFDLGQIALVEQRQLQRAAVGRERPDGRRPERGDPVEPGRLEFFLDAGAGDQAAVADQHHPLQPEAVLDLGNLTGERGRIGGIAFEHLDRDRAAVGGAQQPDDDLRLVAPTVAGCSRSAPARSSGPRDSSR